MLHCVTILPIFAKVLVAAFVLLATDHFTAFLIKYQLHTLLLTFLAFLLVRRLFVLASWSLENLRFHCEEFIQGDAIFGVFVVFLLSSLLRLFLCRSCLLNNGRFLHRSSLSSDFRSCRLRLNFNLGNGLNCRLHRRFGRSRLWELD